MIQYIYKLIVFTLISFVLVGCGGRLATIAKDENIEVVKKEVKTKEDMQELLCWSAYYGKIDKVKYLVENGADVNYNKDDWYNLYPAIIAAAFDGRLNVIKYLVENGADINKQSQYGSTTVSLAAAKGHLDIVRYLAEQGADLYAGKDGNTISALRDNGYEYFIPVVLDIQKNEKVKQKIVDVKYDGDDILSLLKSSKIHILDNTKWLFIIAVENYEYTAPVAYSENSAKDFKKVMKKRLGIPDKNIRTLINLGATSAKINYKLKDMLRRVKKGDTIYFYYSGHGIPVPAKNNAPYMLAQDMNPAYIDDDRFKLENIYKQLSNSKASKVVAFIDSCFSGGTDNQALIKGVAATRVKPKKVTFDKNKMLVISAGSGTQYSNKYDDKSNRLFSYYLMRGLIKNNSNISRLYDYVKSNVQEKSYEMGESYEQVPVYDGNIRLKF